VRILHVYVCINSGDELDLDVLTDSTATTNAVIPYHQPTWCGTCVIYRDPVSLGLVSVLGKFAGVDF
jgi:hypothetical protein